eukprot:Tbor_TRINITY_DN5727_c1_g3::TRINITY_DN5727_c1_g3_i1::g.19894::m.19894
MEEEKKVMSKADRRRLRQGIVPPTQAERDNAREIVREQRKELRMLKSNGSRRKIRKLLNEKRQREEEDDHPEGERPERRRRVETATSVVHQVPGAGFANDDDVPTGPTTSSKKSERKSGKTKKKY